MERKKNAERWHVSFMKTDGTYSDNVFDNKGDAMMCHSYAMGDDLRDDVIGCVVWREFPWIKTH